MYKRIYEKTMKEIRKLELERQKGINESKQDNNSSFSKCKKSALDYMSFKNPTKEQLMRLVDKIEIDKDKKIYAHLKLPELLVEG